MDSKVNFKFVIVEITSVFLAVFLAYQVSEYKKNKEDEEALRVGLEMIKKEMLKNSKALEHSMEAHKIFLENARKLEEEIKLKKDRHFSSIQELLNYLSPSNNLATPNLNRIAYEISKNKNIYAFIDYETAYTISEVYRIMDMGVETTAKNIVPRLSDPAHLQLKNFHDSFVLIHELINELYSQETFLHHKLNEALKKL